MTKRNIIQAFVIAILAVHLIVLFDFLQHKHISLWYSGILLFHTPVWMVFILTGMLVKLKNTYPLLIIASGIAICLQLFVAYKKYKIDFDLLAIYYISVYVFCFAVSGYWRNNQVKKS